MQVYASGTTSAYVEAPYFAATWEPGAGRMRARISGSRRDGKLLYVYLTEEELRDACKTVGLFVYTADEVAALEDCKAPDLTVMTVAEDRIKSIRVSRTEGVVIEFADD